MSPAAVVDFRSPPTSKPPSSSSSSSSLQNANPNSFTPIHLPENNHDQTANPQVFGKASEFVHTSGNGPAVSGRARPRLRKQRMQLHGRPRRAVSGESVSGSGFNALESDSQDWGRSCTSKSGSGVSNAGFVFGANGSKRCENVGLDLNSTVELDSKKGECGGNVRQLSEKEGSLDSKSENGKLRLGFAFGANWNDVGVKLNLENKESSECCLNASGLECGKDSHNEFDDNGSKSNEVDSDGVATCDGGSSTNVGVSGSGFVFGASWFDAGVNLDERKKESGESSGKSVFNDTRKIEVEEAEHHKMKVAAVKFNENRDWKEDDAEGVFVFGRSSKKKNICNEGVFTNRLDEVKSSNETFNVITNNRNCKLDSGINDSFKLASSADNSHVASTSSMNPVSVLSEETKKLNITDIRDVDGADNKNSSAKGESSFVFWSTPSNGNSYFFSPEWNGTTGTDGYEFDSNHKYRSFSAASASIGKSSSELFTFQAGSSRSSVEEKLSHTQVNDDTQNGAAATPTSFSSVVIDSQVNGAVYEATTAAKVREETNKSSSTSSLGGVPFSDFKTPWDPSCLKTSLFPELSKKLEFTVNSRSKKGRRSEMRATVKQHSLHRQQPEQYRVQNERSAQENLNSPGCYSPMDFSPFEETTAAENFSKETSETLNDPNHLENNCVPSILQSTVVACLNESEALDINEDDEKPRETNQESPGYNSERCFMGDYTSKGFVFGAETSCSGFNIEKVRSSGDATAVSAEDTHGSNTETYHHMQFSFASGLEDVHGRYFFFSASSAEQISSSAKRMHRKKNRRKLPCKPSVLAPCPNDQEGNVFTSQNAAGNKSEANEKAMQCPISSSGSVQEVCEIWRARGNNAYQTGDMLKAEDFYTRGINSVPSGEILGSSLKSLVVCYSNRAATRMSLGNLRGALRDCVKAAALDPQLLKVQMRAANCHLQLGEAGNALQCFNRCLVSEAGVCLDRRITIEAADGLQKAQKVADCINRSAKLLEQRTHDAALSALDVIAEALLISPYSESLLEMKAEFLFMLRKHTEVIQLCEQSLGAAEKNFSSLGADGQFVDSGCSESESCSFARVWRWHLMSKSYFYMGKVEAALDLLEKLEQMRPISFKYASANKILESSVTLAVTIRDLLRHKSAGNESVRSGQYTEAAEHYTAALLNNIESRPFAAICFGNRAAAHQALGQIADAIADCSLAIAFDGNYSKPVSRRAALHELIRDYGQAANDLQRLVSLLENQSDEKARQLGTPARSSSRTKELRQARRHLSLMVEEAKKGIPLDLYRILGVKDCDTVSDIRKAYRKAALKHHPDKAGQFLARSESGDDGLLWKEMVQEVHTDAERLFKMIGEAYAVLSDPTKRSEYDLDEEIRKASKENNGSANRTSRARSNPYERNDNRRYWQDNWKTHGYSRSRW